MNIRILSNQKTMASKHKFEDCGYNNDPASIEKPN